MVVAGVELDKAMGSHDGTTGDGQYFECEDKFGIVTKPSKLVDAFPVGSRVAVQGYEGAAGTVRYCGRHLAKKKKTVTGVELDQPIGKNNGSTKDGQCKVLDMVFYFFKKNSLSSVLAPLP